MTTPRRLASVVVLALACGSTPASAQRADPYPWSIEQVGDGVFAALQPGASRFDESNSTVIIGDDEVVVVDAQSNPAAVEGLIAWIRTVTDAPVRLVINTHWHGDHSQGNATYRAQFGDQVEFWGHESLGEDVPERAAAFVAERVAYFDAELPAARERLAAGVFRDGSAMTEADRQEQAGVLARADAWLQANRGAQFLPPTHVYADRQVLERAGRTLELRHFRGHTRGDTVIWLPAERIAITGDLLDDLPYVGHGYPSSWLAALDRIRELPIAAAVPGHGPVFRSGAKLDAVQGYLGALVRQVGTAAREGLDLDAAAASVDLEQWRQLLVSDEASAEFFDQVVGEAIERAWLEARGELR